MTIDPTFARELLAFQAAAGVDCALGDEPVDRLADPLPPPPIVTEVAGAVTRGVGAAPARRVPTQAPATATPSPPAPGSAAASARELARTAGSLDDLRALLDRFDGCPLKATASRLVFADGNPKARVMFVGEAPGRDEDIEGLPFVGRSGKLLDRMMATIGLDRGSVYIANIVPWRPPGNRTPTPHETEICRPFIERQVELVAPKILVTLGAPSARTLLHATDGILKLRGNWQTHETRSGLSIPAMPTLHPAYLLRNPAHKKLAWRDFLAVKMRLEAKA